MIQSLKQISDPVLSDDINKALDVVANIKDLQTHYPEFRLDGCEARISQLKDLMLNEEARRSKGER